jgi:ketosteroid isomerase-like protein
MRIACVVAVLAAVGGGLEQTPSASATSAEVAVRQSDEAWAKAIATKSLDQTVAMYDPEAVTAGSAMFPARGVEAFRTNWASLFAQAGFALTWTAEKVVVTDSGTIAYSSGTWRMTGPTASGPYLAVWRRQPDGQWKVLVDAAWFARPPE